MSSAEAGPSRRRRRYVAKACNSCRRRRCKCDGVQPTCGTCAATGHECSWSTESNARRPATKQLVESLRIKIQVLEAEIARLRGTSPADEVEPSLGLGGSVGGSSASRHQSYTSTDNLLEDESISESTIPVGSTHSPSPSVERTDDSLRERSPPASSTQFTATVMYKYIFQIDHAISIDEQPTDTQLSLVCEWNRHLPPLGHVEFSRAEHDSILSRCFKYGTSWALGLVPEIFLHDMLYSLSSAPAEAQSDTPARLQHYTPMLHCAILAFGCAFSDDEAIRSRETREKFAIHARTWLDEEFRQPVMSLIRALTLLADYYCAVGQREMGYMFMGMGIRAARANKLMSLDFGRPADMPIPRFGVNLPSVDSELDSQPWPLDPTEAGANAKNPPKITTLVFLESCKLMVIATRVIEATLPLPQEPSNDNVALSLHLQLETWFNNLPERLLVWARSTYPLPYVILLHICYWWLLIYLHRPFYRRAHPKDPSLFAPSHSVKICNRGAHKVVQLLSMFDDQHGLRYFPRNMLAAITTCGEALLMEIASAPPGAVKKRSTAREGVEVCIRALRTTADTWPCAEALADELEARLEDLHPPSGSNSDEMEVDQLSNPLP